MCIKIEGERQGYRLNKKFKSELLKKCPTHVRNAMIVFRMDSVDEFINCIGCLLYDKIEPTDEVGNKESKRNKGQE